MKSCLVLLLFIHFIATFKNGHCMCKNLKKNNFGTSMKTIFQSWTETSFRSMIENLYYFHAWAKFTFFLNINSFFFYLTNTKKKKAVTKFQAKPKFIFFNNFKRLIIMMIITITILTVFSYMMKITFFFSCFSFCIFFVFVYSLPGHIAQVNVPNFSCEKLNK